MSKIKELLKSPHIQIAIATGICIIILAYVSKRILPQPMSELAIAIPPFLMTIYEAVLSRHKDSKISTPWYWILAIFAATAILILFHVI